MRRVGDGLMQRGRMGAGSYVSPRMTSFLKGNWISENV
jgi:hypothetical protein